MDETQLSSAELQEAWNGSLETDAGRAYYVLGEESDMREAAAAVKPFQDEYAVDAHGDADHIYYGDTAFDSSNMAELIRADPGWGEQPVRLVSCETGQGEHPIAQDLADELGVDVTAPTELAWSGPSGDVSVAPGEWQLINGELVMTRGEPLGESGWQRFSPTEKAE